jgi:hypothetical protein
MLIWSCPQPLLYRLCQGIWWLLVIQDDHPEGYGAKERILIWRFWYSDPGVSKMHEWVTLQIFRKNVSWVGDPTDVRGKQQICLRGNWCSIS